MGIIVKRNPKGADPQADRAARKLGNRLLKYGGRLLRTIRNGFIINAKRVRDGLVLVEVIDPPLHLLAAGTREGNALTGLKTSIGAVMLPGRVARLLNNLTFDASVAEQRQPYLAYINLRTGAAEVPTDPITGLPVDPDENVCSPFYAWPIHPAGVVTAHYMSPDVQLSIGDNARCDVQVLLGAAKFSNTPYASIGLRIDDLFVNGIEAGYELVPRHDEIPGGLIAPRLTAAVFIDWLQDTAMRPAIASEQDASDASAIWVRLNLMLPAHKRRDQYDITGLLGQVGLEVTFTLDKTAPLLTVNYSSLFWDLNSHPTAAFQPETSVNNDGWSDRSYRAATNRVLASEVGYVPDPAPPAGSYPTRATAVTVAFIKNRVGDFRHYNTFLIVQDFEGAFSYQSSDLLWKQKVYWDPPEDEDTETHSYAMSSTSGPIGLLGACHYNGAWYVLVLEVNGTFKFPMDLGILDLSSPGNLDVIIKRYLADTDCQIRTYKFTAPGIGTQQVKPVGAQIPMAAPRYLRIDALEEAMLDTANDVQFKPIPRSNLVYVGDGLAVCAVRTAWAPSTALSVTLGYFDLELGEFITLVDAGTQAAMVQVPLWGWTEGTEAVVEDEGGPQLGINYFVAITVDQTLQRDELGRVTRYPRLYATYGVANQFGYQTAEPYRHRVKRTLDGGQSWFECDTQASDAGYWDLGSVTIAPIKNEQDRGF